MSKHCYHKESAFHFTNLDPTTETLGYEFQCLDVSTDQAKAKTQSRSHFNGLLSHIQRRPPAPLNRYRLGTKVLPPVAAIRRHRHHIGEGKTGPPTSPGTQGAAVLCWPREGPSCRREQGTIGFLVPSAERAPPSVKGVQ